MVRVHPELLANEKIPSSWFPMSLWKKRFEDINAFERYLSGNGIRGAEVFPLHLSKKERRKRFLDRIEDPEKNWKFSMSAP